MERYLETLFPALERRGHTPGLLYEERRGEARYAGRHGIAVAGLRDGFRAHDADRMEKVLDAVRGFAPDLIYMHSTDTPALARELSRLYPVVGFSHGENLVCPKGIKAFPRDFEGCRHRAGWLSCGLICSYIKRYGSRHPARIKAHLDWMETLRTGYRGVRKWVVASGYMKESLARDGYDPSSIHVISYFAHRPAEEDAAREGGSKVVVAGRLIPQKGMDHAIRALKELPAGVRLTVVGDGPDRARLENLASILGIGERVEFAGELVPSEVDRVFRSANLLVVPSLYPEPFGIVGIEAMARGLPVVAYDTGGISEWLSDGRTGILVPRARTDRLSDAMRSLLENPVQAARYGKEGLDSFGRRFTEESHLARLEALFEEALEEGVS